jgi:hypothetical protein
VGQHGAGAGASASAVQERESAQARGYRRAAGQQAGRNVSRKRVESKKSSECGVCMARKVT